MMGKLSFNDIVVIITLVIFLVVLGGFMIEMAKQDKDMKCSNAFGSDFRFLKEVIVTAESTHTVYCGNGKEIKNY